jgi:hypothetical protein
MHSGAVHPERRLVDREEQKRRREVLRASVSLPNYLVDHLLQHPHYGYLEGLRALKEEEDVLHRKLMRNFFMELQPVLEQMLARLQVSERSRRNHIIRERDDFFNKFLAFFRFKTGEKGLPELEVVYFRRSAFLWLAETVGRQEIEHRKQMVGIEAVARRDLWSHFNSVFTPSSLLKKGSVERHRAEAWEAHLAKLHQLRLERQRGVWASQLHALVTQHQASRLRLEWEEEFEGAEIRKRIARLKDKIAMTLIIRPPI